MIDCQKAKPFEGTDFPAIVDPKIDGIRAIAYAEDGEWRIQPRSGKSSLNNYGHILEQLEAMVPQNFVLDGELYAGSFKETVSICRTERAVLGAEKKLILIAFDLILKDEFVRSRFVHTQLQRKEALDSLYDESQHRYVGEPFEDGLTAVVPAPWKLVESEEELQAAYELFVDQGFEGAMVKNPKAPYTTRRSLGWQKMKPRSDGEFRITAFMVGEGKFEGTLGAIVFDLGNGEEGKVGTGFTEFERDKIWEYRTVLFDRYVTVEYQEKTPDGKLRFPRFKGLRMNPGGGEINLEAL